jgi:hypothetical protein
MKVKTKVRENIAVDTKKMNKTDKLLSPDLLRKMNAYWRAANHLSVGQICLYDNPLLKEPLKLSHVKPLVVGHWGTTPGQNFIYVHLNRVIKNYDLDMFYIAGPGHGGPAIVGNVYLEGTWSEVYRLRDGHTARQSSRYCKGGCHIRRRLAAIQKTSALQSSARQAIGESVAPSCLWNEVLPIRRGLEEDLFRRFHRG